MPERIVRVGGLQNTPKTSNFNVYISKYIHLYALKNILVIKKIKCNKRKKPQKGPNIKKNPKTPRNPKKTAIFCKENMYQDGFGLQVNNYLSIP